jgi:hypothetical protein
MSAKLLELIRVELKKRYSFALRGMPAIRCARSRRRVLAEIKAGPQACADHDLVTAPRPGHSATTWSQRKLRQARYDGSATGE